MTFWQTLKAKLAAWLAPILFLAVICAVGAAWYEGKQAGTYAVRFHTADSTVKAVASRVPAVDSIFVHDTVRLTVVRHRTDSLLRVDTIPIPVPVVKEIVRAERASCDTVVNACQAKVAIRDSELVAVNNKLKLALNKPGAPRFPSCVAGAGIGTAGKFELSVTCGVRLH